MKRHEPEKKVKLRKKVARAIRPKQRPMGFSALEAGDMDMLRMKLAQDPDLAHCRDLNGASLLLTAVFRGATEAVALLEETAGPLDAFEAAALGRTDRLAELLDAGEVRLSDQSPEGFGLLHLAAFFGQTEVAEMLLGRGADIEAVAAHGMAVRPLHSAAAGRKKDVVLFFLEKGADIDARQGGGFSVLHHAAGQGNLELVRKLLARGADPAAKSDAGRMPVDLAKSAGHAEIVKLLGG